MPCATSTDGTLSICRPPGTQSAAGAKLAVWDDRAGRMVEIDMGWKGGQLAWCRNCRRRRRLSSLRVTLQAYYDPAFFCVDRAKCAKAKTQGNAKRNAARRRRYAAQRARERGGA